MTPLQERIAEMFAGVFTEEELEGFRKKAEEDKKVFLYRDHRPETVLPWDGTQPLRFKVPQIQEYTWHDEVRGELHAGIEALDDFILIKSDGYPTYNFAHIIDDLEMGVTHIMRADEFIASTPKFLSLYEALGIQRPHFVTLPPILGKEGTKKLGKRDGAKDILDYRKEGYLPGALVNFLALLGWNPGGDKEIFTEQELIEAFSIERIHKSSAMFNEEKLLWMNKEHLKFEKEEVVFSAVQEYMKDYPEDLLKRALPSVLDRISYYGELLSVEPNEFHFLISAPTPDIEKVVWKDSGKASALTHLRAVRNMLLMTDFSSAETVKSSIMPYAEVSGKGDVLWPLRVTLSGQEKSIDPFTLCYILGKDETLQRIDTMCQALDS